MTVQTCRGEVVYCSDATYDDKLGAEAGVLRSSVNRKAIKNGHAFMTKCVLLRGVGEELW